MQDEFESGRRRDARRRRARAREATPEDYVPATGVEEEKTVGAGHGRNPRALLRDRSLIEEGQGRGAQREVPAAAALPQRVQRDGPVRPGHRAQRERDRTSGRLERMSAREREDWQRQQNTMRDQHQSRVVDQLFREGRCRPDVGFKYVDGDGPEPDAKEAFKELSHQFHGKGSGKGKTDKRAEEAGRGRRGAWRRACWMPAKCGHELGGVHQTKKRREAGCGWLEGLGRTTSKVQTSSISEYMGSGLY